MGIHMQIYEYKNQYKKKDRKEGKVIKADPRRCKKHAKGELTDSEVKV